MHRTYNKHLFYIKFKHKGWLISVGRYKSVRLKNKNTLAPAMYRWMITLWNLTLSPVSFFYVPFTIKWLLVGPDVSLYI